MTRLIIITLCLFYFTHTSSSQIKNAIITYKKVKLKKRFGKNNKNLSKTRLKKFSEIEKKMDEVQSRMNFILFFNGEMVTFEAEKVLMNKENKFTKAAVGPDASGVFYNDKNKNIRMLHAFGQDFLISYPKHKWNLVNEKKIIGNYLCNKAEIIKIIKTKKAEKKVKIIAWYTKDINIPFGPIGYSGLPGLIINLEANNYLYSVNKIELNSKKNIKIKEPNKGKKITEEEFKEIARITMKNSRKKP